MPYSLDEILTICGEVNRRVKGKMTDEEFKSFREMIQKPAHCEKCDDTGVYPQETGGMMVCTYCDYHSKRGRRLNRVFIR